ncbi:hemin uptake protein HemP [Rubripirellula lacrimiformis]|nr:hemin uptake protein HemP [Rubripirellula lacrimiformis]
MGETNRSHPTSLSLDKPQAMPDQPHNAAAASPSNLKAALEQEAALGQKTVAATPVQQEVNPNHPALPKIVKFSDLARCGDEIWIEHENQLYRLRATRQNKLILTK